MSTSRSILIASILVVSAAFLGIAVADGDGAGDAPAAEARVQAAAFQDSDIGPALFDPCQFLPEAEAELAFAIFFGTEHEAFIALLILQFLDFTCNSPLDGAAQPQGGLINVHIEGEAGGNFVPVDGTWDPVTMNIEADGVGTVAGFQNVTVTLEMHIAGTGEITGEYVMGAAGELPGGNPAKYEISGQVGLITPTQSPTATPNPGTPTPTSDPTPTDPPGAELVWGNWDCDTGVSTRDNQATLRFVLQQNPLGQTEPCTDIGNSLVFTVPASGQTELWGDADCDSAITTRDNQAVLRNVLQQNPLGQTEPCPDIGSSILAAN